MSEENPDDQTVSEFLMNGKKVDGKAFLLRKLGNECAICGFKARHPSQMSIHEVGGRVDAAGEHPSNLLQSKSGFLVLLANIESLVPLCLNCHALAHQYPFHKEVAEAIDRWRARPRRKK